MSQTANAGAGGDSYAGAVGSAGVATSNLTFDDTANAAESSSVSGAAYANGGAGGWKERFEWRRRRGSDQPSLDQGRANRQGLRHCGWRRRRPGVSNANGAVGGAGVASATAASTGLVNGATVLAQTEADGGAGGYGDGSGHTGAAGGSASATANATGAGADTSQRR